MGLILTNARIYTFDATGSIVDTIVIEEDRVVFVGARAAWSGDDAAFDVHDLGGRTVTPSFIDAHSHPGAVAKSLWHVRLPWTTDLDEILDFIRRYAEAHPPEEAPYLYFEYYPSELFSDAPPTKELLDSVVSDRPVLCQDFSEHEHWVNSRMLELMGITRDTPDPVPGLEMFFRDERGEPTGRLREMVHLHFLDTMYDALGWRPPEHITPDRLAQVLEYFTQQGVTAILDAVVDSDEILQALAELERQGRLHLNYEGAIRFRTKDDITEAIARARDYDDRYATSHVRVRTLKLFLDGTNEGANSALLAPLYGHGGGHGEIGMEVDELTQCLRIANGECVDVHIHVTGDRAFRVACDAVAAARAATGEERWVIQVTLAHCELVDDADIPRPAELDIIVNWTPHWSGGYFGDSSRAHLGPERWERMYRFNQIADHGALLTFSSDVVTAYELHRAAPLFGMQVAMTRIDPEYPLAPATYSDSVRPDASAAIGAARLLQGYTIDAARQLRHDDRTGSIEPGKLANLVVLSADPHEAAPDTVASIQRDAVIFEGTVIFGVL